MSEDTPTTLPVSAVPTLRLLGVLTRFKAGVDVEARVLSTILGQPATGLLVTFQTVESQAVGTVCLTEEGATTARRLAKYPAAEDLPEDLRVFALQAAGMDCFSYSYTEQSEHCQTCSLAFACREMCANNVSLVAQQLRAADRSEQRKVDAQEKAAQERKAQEDRAAKVQEMRDKADINDVMRRLKATAQK
jgi:hypothetical protein